MKGPHSNIHLKQTGMLPLPREKPAPVEQIPPYLKILYIEKSKGKFQNHTDFEM